LGGSIPLAPEGASPLGAFLWKKSPPPGVAQGAPIDQAQEAMAPNTPEIPLQSPVVDPGLLALLAEGAIGEGTGDVSQQRLVF
jgi:hypothetical protein